MFFQSKNLKVEFINNDKIKVIQKNKEWQTSQEFKPWIELKQNGEIVRCLLQQAKKIEMSPVKSNLGEGVRTIYTGFGKEEELCLETIWWLDKIKDRLYAWVQVLSEENTAICQIAFPQPFSFEKMQDDNITVLPLVQGCLIPNGYHQEFELENHWELETGLFYTRSAYMPWWGQIDGRQGYLAIAQTPWDGGISVCHPKDGATHIRTVWKPSLGKMGYGRCVRFEFFDDCNYVSLCKQYRNYLKESGELYTLKEKILQNPKTEKLIGTSIIHTGIYQEVKPSCKFFDVENPETVFVPYFNTFEERANQVEKLKEKGLENAYLHLDGWGNAGYDSQHPDMLPPAPRAGGWEGMKQLQDATRKNGWLFALHDQYRDYYLDAPSYQDDLAIKDQKGEIPQTNLWVGGTQAFLCPSKSQAFIERNYTELMQEGLKPDGVYLDVFACVALDECWDKKHPVTRKECLDYRQKCFSWMRANGIIVSSEEGIGWAMKQLDLVHHAPYAMIHTSNDEKLCGENTGIAYGIPVPLLNLVYHDCVVFPWFVQKEDSEMPTGQSGFLHALLNAGVPYVDIEASEEEIKTAKIVSQLHKKLALCEMTDHQFVDGNLMKQRATYSDGSVVEVDFESDCFEISKIEKDEV